MDVRRRAAPAARLTSRRIAGDQAERAVARHLECLGWRILARNVRVGRSEVDIVAREPDGMLVFVEVRSRSGSWLGMPEETVDRAKVARLYAAAWRLMRVGALPDGEALEEGPSRVDLVTVVRDEGGAWRLRGHLRGLDPP